MAKADYFCCAKCDGKVIYDGYYERQDELCHRFGIDEARGHEIALICHECSDDGHIHIIPPSDASNSTGGQNTGALPDAASPNASALSGNAETATLRARVAELEDALEDSMRWVAAYARGRSADEHKEVLKSPRYAKCRAVLKGGKQ